ncbi:MAG: type VI secretion system Vgr family protein [Panacagrimonas sp.]
MAELTGDSSKNRWIDLDTPLPKGTLVVEKVTGVETLGRLFEYELFALGEKSDIKFDDLLGLHATLGLELPDGKRRLIDGRIAQIGLVGTAGRLFRYRLMLRPWLWMLTRTADSRIFQEKTVKEIIEDVFADQADATFEFRLSGSYIKREYCVQYRETDFNFVSRLMEEEGMYYFFEHKKGKHTLVICDAASAHASVGKIAFLPSDRQAREGQQYVSDWSVTREIQPGATALRDYDFEKPSVDLLAKRSQDRPHSEAAHEVFDYPGGYILPAAGTQIARTRLEELQAAHEVIEGRGNARIIASGGLFTLADFARADQNREYLVVSAHIEASNNLVESGGGGASSFDCRFELIPGKEPYRAPRNTRRPIVQGPQTAVVVGPAGEEIFVDKYGRVKVQFHWDRLGKNDDKSSCWVRVSQIWAGKNFGWVTLPRIKQEVIVDFLEGDPDRPIITGRVYNAEQMPPWALPANKTQSGILTRSSMGGAPANANEFRFEDKKGAEQVFLHAEKNQDIEVENDETHWVGHDRKKTIDHDENVEVKNNRTEKVGVDEKITIGKNRTENVGVNEEITIGANRTEKVGANEDITVGANRTEKVGANESVTIAANRDLTAGGSETLTIGGSQSETIGGSLTQTVAGGITVTTPGSMKVTAVGGVTFTAPGGFTVIAPGGTKTIDNFFDRIGLNTKEIFSSKTDILNMSNSISNMNIGFALNKIDTAANVAELIGVKNMTFTTEIQAVATKIQSGAVAIKKAAMTIIG